MSFKGFFRFFFVPRQSSFKQLPVLLGILLLSVFNVQRRKFLFFIFFSMKYFCFWFFPRFFILSQFKFVYVCIFLFFCFKIKKKEIELANETTKRRKEKLPKNNEDEDSSVYLCAVLRKNLIGSI